jgi:hypothetical protein
MDIGMSKPAHPKFLFFGSKLLQKIKDKKTFHPEEKIVPADTKSEEMFPDSRQIKQT